MKFNLIGKQTAAIIPSRLKEVDALGIRTMEKISLVILVLVTATLIASGQSILIEASSLTPSGERVVEKPAFVQNSVHYKYTKEQQSSSSDNAAF